MKKLGKLSINVDKIIKNEELVNLKGGDYYSTGCTYCWCKKDGVLLGPAILDVAGPYQCFDICTEIYPETNQAKCEV